MSHPPTPPQRPHVAANTPANGIEFIDAGLSVETPSGSPTKGSSNLLRAGLIIALGVVGVVGAFAVRTALVQPAGPQTPDETVERLFEAIENEDVLGAAELLLPSERESIVEPGLELFAEIERIGVIKEGTDLGSVDGIDVEIDGLTYVSSAIGSTVVNVTVTGGTVTTTTRPGELPLGETLTTRFDEPLSSLPPEVNVEDLAGEDLRFTVVEEDGGWYVSIWYSAAEAIRRETAKPVPAFGAGPTPVGAATAEGAVQAMADELLDLDLAGVLTLLDPQEARAAYDYAPLWFPEWQAELDQFWAEASQDDRSWTLESLEVSSRDRRGDTVVTVNSFVFRFSDAYDNVTVTYDGNCFTYRDQYDSESFCPSDFDSWAVMSGGLANVSSGIVVVERDGRWYLSVMPSVIGGFVDALAQIETGTVEGIDDDFDRWMDELAREFGFSDGYPGFEAYEEPTVETFPTTTMPSTNDTLSSEVTGPSATDPPTPSETPPPAKPGTAPPETPSTTSAPSATSAPFTTGLPTEEQLANYTWDPASFPDDVQVFASSPGWWIDPNGAAPVTAVSVWDPSGTTFLEVAEYGTVEEFEEWVFLAYIDHFDVDPNGIGRVQVNGLNFVRVDRYLIVSMTDDASLAFADRTADHLLGYLSQN